MADQLLPSRVILRDTDADRSPLPGGTATFVETGTTTPVTVYADAGLTTPLANPVTADSTGALPAVWYGGIDIVDCIVKRANGTTVETLARVPRYGEETSAASGISFVPAGRIAATDVQGAIEELESEFEALGLRTAQRFATYGGTADAITLTSGSSHDALVVGMAFRFRATAVNTGNVTVNLDGLGAIAARTITRAVCPAGYIRTDVETVCWYDGSNWIIDRLPGGGDWTNGGVDGRWTRWANGDVEIWGEYDDSAPGWATAAGAGYTRSSAYEFNLPFTLAAVPDALAGARRNSTAIPVGAWVTDATASSVWVMPYGLASVPAATTKFITVHVRGRWY